MGCLQLGTAEEERAGWKGAPTGSSRLPCRAGVGDRTAPGRNNARPPTPLQGGGTGCSSGPSTCSERGVPELPCLGWTESREGAAEAGGRGFLLARAPWSVAAPLSRRFFLWTRRPAV